MLADLRPPGGWFASPSTQAPAETSEAVASDNVAPASPATDPPAVEPNGRHRPPMPRVRLARLPVPSPVRERPAGSEWLEHAACAGMAPDLFFPARGESSKEAKAICAGCPVRECCLEHALDAVEKHGIWGGKSERERRRLRRERAAAKRGAA